MSDDKKEETRSGPSLTHSQSVNRLQEINAELERLAELNTLTPEDEAYFEELRDEFFEVDEYRKRLERAAELAKVRSAHGQIGQPASSRLRIVPGSPQGSRADYDRDAILEPDSVEDCRFRDPWNLSEVRTFGRDSGEVAGELRARALSAIEKMQGANDKVRAAATDIVERYDTTDGRLARQVLLTSSPAYLRAWSKHARGQANSLSQDEMRAWNEVEQFRAMSLTDSAGGYLVPFQLDPTVIITSSGSRNDIRMVARQVVATGDTWNGVSSGAVSWSWDAEAAQVSDDTTTFAQPSIPVYKASGFVPISLEALQDEANVTQEVGRLLAFGKDELEATAFATGSGTGQPTGIVTALAASAGGASIVTAAADDTFAIGDVYKVHGALPARYRANASWLGNNLIYHLIRQFDTAGGAGLWERIGGDRPAQLLGRPVYEAEAMDGTITTSGAVANYALIIGDFSNYVIADRIGLTVEFIPQLFSTSNNRPTGQRGWFAHYRCGADSVSDNAFRVLNVASAS
ncbi:MAG: phage major capsid protein [Desulfurellales bacterium]|nr:MAG: phage major capsid protein [Desulfurellales bacterium]